MIFFDTETIGLHGLPVLIQYAYDDGPVILHNIWKEEINDTLELIEDFCRHPGGVCGFNLAFDWFHICKIYTTFRLLDADILPLHQVDEVAKSEKEGRFGPCLKPVAACDLMLHARKGPYQSTMDRNDITIKRVPSALAQKLADHLAQAIPLKDIYFARKTDKKQRWQLQDITNDLGDIDPYFKNVVLRFAPSSALKALAVDALGVAEDNVLKFIDISPPSFKKTNEIGYAPFALAIGEPGAWNKSWPFWVWEDTFFWETNKPARKYAEDDVIYTRDLYYHFDRPEPNDNDSILACMVASVRWRGYAVDIEAIRNLRDTAQAMINSLPFNVNSPEVCKKYLKAVMTDLEYGVMTFDGKTSTKKVILEEVSKWTEDEICTECEGDGCDLCPEGDGVLHPAALRAQEILDARSACKEIELYDKLILAGRFHASFKVIGALSSRMSGADGLNAQGIKRANYVRECFTLKDKGLLLSGGDFDAFEMSIMDAAYKDTRMHAELLGDYKIHGLWGQRYFFPRMSYDEIGASKGSANPWQDFYSRSKNGVFAICYFGEGHTLTTRVGIPEEVANEAYERIMADYPEFAEARKDVIDMFCSMRQPEGIGTKVEWHPPADYVESLLGFRRYFTLENQICEALFNLAEKPPKDWSSIKIKVTRRDRVQSACGAMRSALFAAAFAVQSSNMRAAGNHRIQSTGAEVTKDLEAKLWEFQPSGINSWVIQLMNIHDELMAAHTKELLGKLEETVVAFVEETKKIIPLVGVDWQSDIDNWSGKSGGNKDANDTERENELREALS